jgi:hypothetical protein
MKRTAYKLIILVCFIALIYIAVDIVNEGVKRGISFDRYSSYRSDEKGTRGFFLLLEEMGYDVSRYMQKHISRIPKGVVFAITPRYGFFEFLGGNVSLLKRKSEWDKWISEGGQLVLFSRRPALERFGSNISITTAKGFSSENAVVLENAGDFLRPGLELALGPHSVFAGVPPGAVKLADVGGSPCAIRIPHGNGSYTVVLSDYIISNEGIADSANVEFCLGLANEGNPEKRIYFNEFDHGIVAEKGIIDLIVEYRLHWFILQLVFVMCIIAWMLTPRDGAPRKPLPMPSGRETEFAHTVAELYRQNLPAKFLMNTLLGEVRARLVRKKLLAPRADVEELQAALSRAGVGDRTIRAIMSKYGSTSRKFKPKPSDIADFYASVRKSMEEMDGSN